MTPEQNLAMIAALLKDRFGLVVHNETREQPVFELTLMPDGPKFHETPLPAATEDNPHPVRRNNWSMSNDHLSADGTQIGPLADSLSYALDRVVLDKTGLTGSYSFTMKWTPQDDAATARDKGIAGEPPPDIFTALKEQLGLKLTPTKASVPAVVVDNVQQPEPN